ncbi:unnamed protein product [Rhizophagus irregularis]|nr:unnamed protein product [Rhizophagus irregularis]
MVFRYSTSESQEMKWASGVLISENEEPKGLFGVFNLEKRNGFTDDGNDPVLDVWIMEIKMNRFRAFWIMEIETNRNAGRNYDPNFGDGNVKWTRFRSLFSGRLLDGRISKVPGYRFNILKVLELRNYWIFVI